MGQVIKGRKYILAGNFPAEHKETFVKTLTEELGIEVVAVITSDNTKFIEYKESDDLVKLNGTLITDNVCLKEEIDASHTINDKLIKENKRLKDKIDDYKKNYSKKLFK